MTAHHFTPLSSGLDVLAMEVVVAAAAATAKRQKKHSKKPLIVHHVHLPTNLNKSPPKKKAAPLINECEDIHVCLYI